MSIAALPDETSRLLGSSPAISSPTTLVKELLENAIDADATSVDVLVSDNTVDRIEVRDNGHGIHPDDFDALGRRAHTSKLRGYEELKEGRITTLGFRGEALAAANTVGAVCITTRTDRDVVGTVLSLHPGIGGPSSRSKAPSPAGTTVLVTGLFSQLPVRRQVAMKEAPLAFSKIKRLLHSYALAKPHLKLSLKIAKHAKPPWSYSPRPGAQLREAVLQIFGADLASQCQERTASSGDRDTPNHLVIEAYLPKPGSDPTKISHGAFVSVDSRPLCSTIGIAKKLVSIYRRQLSASASAAGSQQVKDPFIVVNVKSAAGSYDPNVESSKNDVLFAEQAVLLRLFETLCKDIYGQAREHREGATSASPPEEQATRPVSNILPGAATLGEHAVCSVPSSEEETVTLRRDAVGPAVD